MRQFIFQVQVIPNRKITALKIKEAFLSYINGDKTIIKGQTNPDPVIQKNL